MKLRTIFLLAFVSLVSSYCSGTQEKALSPEEFDAAIQADPDAVIVDVRTPKEFAEGFIVRAQNVDFNNSNFRAAADDLDRNKAYYVYCLAGSRSADAAAYMRAQGFKSVYELKGGLIAWQKSNLPLAQAVSPGMSNDKISMEAFRAMVKSDTAVLVDFYAPWCGPCKRLEPILEEFGREKAGKIKIIRLNIDESKSLAGQLGITQIPLLKLFKAGKETWSNIGLLDKKALETQTAGLY
jgi:thioredoxin